MKRTRWLALVCAGVALCAATAQGALIGYWTFEDLISPYNDVSGNGNNGTPSGSPTVGGGVVGDRALLLNGASFLNIGSNAVLDAETYTISAWLNTRDVTGWRTAVGSWFVGNYWVHYGLNDTRRASNFVYIDGAQNNIVDATTNIYPNRWYHVASVVDKANKVLQLWVDGTKTLEIPKATWTTTQVPGANNAYIGSKDGTPTGNYWYGLIDDVRIYSNALTQSEIQALAATATPPTGRTGPGGLERSDVSSALLYWLRADAGVVQTGGAVSAWNDQTSRGNNFSQGTAGARPVLTPNVLNGQPVVRFDGTDDRLTLSTLTAPQTVFIVNAPSQYVWLAGVWGSNNPTDKGIRIDPTTGATAWRHTGDANDFTNGTNGAMYINGAATNTFGSYATPQILTAYRGSSSPNYNVTQLGWYYSARVFSGDVAEVIVYDRALNSAERTVVENYLSSRYNVPLAAGDHYTGDTPANGDYDLDVFGVGRVDVANQVLLAGAAGLGIEAFAGTLDNGEWVLAGHRTPVNSQQELRWARDWFIEKTGSVDVMLTFDASDAGIPLPGTLEGLLLYSGNGTTFTPLPLAGTTSGDEISFLVPDSMFATGYYTLGQVPEPTTLGLLGLGLAGIAARRRRKSPPCA